MDHILRSFYNLTPEGERDTELFRLILSGFYLLSVEEPWLITTVMEIRLLQELGYQPRLDDCVNCVKPNCKPFSLRGYIEQCSEQTQISALLNSAVRPAVIYKQLMKMEFTKLNRLRNFHHCKRELDEMLDLYITFVWARN